MRYPGSLPSPSCLAVSACFGRALTELSYGGEAETVGCLTLFGLAMSSASKTWPLNFKYFMRIVAALGDNTLPFFI